VSGVHEAARIDEIEFLDHCVEGLAAAQRCDGRKRLREETAGWQRFVSAMGAALNTSAGEVS